MYQLWLLRLLLSMGYLYLFLEELNDSHSPMLSVTFQENRKQPFMQCLFSVLFLSIFNVLVMFVDK